jgi:GTP-binding protein
LIAGNCTSGWFINHLCSMQIVKASYLISSPGVNECPKADRSEFAFIGRSNVGKSSLINLICDNAKLAKTSATPGKTQMINHFTIVSAGEKTHHWYLVDLPGYGYAKVSLGKRRTWSQFIENYLRKRETLKQLFVLIDSRHSPQKIDLEFVDQLGKWELPFCIVFTKTDKSLQKDVAANIKAFGEAMLQNWEDLPPMFATSAVKKTGRKEILKFIEEQLIIA